MSRDGTGRSMACEASLEAVSARLDGELDEVDAVALDTHLAECPGCRETAASLEVQHRRLRIRVSPPMPDLAARVFAPNRPRRLASRWWQVAVAVVVPLLLGLAYVQRTSTPDRPPLLALAHGRLSEARQGGASVVTLEVTNGGGGDRVVSASTPLADRVEIHQLSLDAGLEVMRDVSSVPIPAGATASLGEGGAHLMLIGLHEDLVPGEVVPVAVEFARAGTVTLDAVVS